MRYLLKLYHFINIINTNNLTPVSHLARQRQRNTNCCESYKLCTSLTSSTIINLFNRTLNKNNQYNQSMPTVKTLNNLAMAYGTQINTQTRHQTPLSKNLSKQPIKNQKFKRQLFVLLAIFLIETDPTRAVKQQFSKPFCKDPSILQSLMNFGLYVMGVVRSIYVGFYLRSLFTRTGQIIKNVHWFCQHNLWSRGL